MDMVLQRMTKFSLDDALRDTIKKVEDDKEKCQLCRYRVVDETTKKVYVLTMDLKHLNSDEAVPLLGNTLRILGVD